MKSYVEIIGEHVSKNSRKFKFIFSLRGNLQKDEYVFSIFFKQHSYKYCERYFHFSVSFIIDMI